MRTSVSYEPYVGITGFKTVEEVRELTRSFLDLEQRYCTRYTMMVGLLSSAKKLANPSVGGTETPAVNDLAELARVCPRMLFPVVHYFTENREKLADEATRVFETNHLYDFCQGLQVNMSWPNVQQLQRLESRFRDLKIILQLPPAATSGLSAAEIASMCGDYSGLVSYVLIDPSRGHGLEFELDSSCEVMSAVSRKVARVGICGGLGPDNVRQRFLDVASTFGEGFCVDAQGKLRSADKTCLNLAAAKEYLQGVFQGIIEAKSLEFDRR
jgi:hypothetical protein